MQKTLTKVRLFEQIKNFEKFYALIPKEIIVEDSSQAF